jgi:hypothetical protein
MVALSIASMWGSAQDAYTAHTGSPRQALLTIASAAGVGANGLALAAEASVAAGRYLQAADLIAQPALAPLAGAGLLADIVTGGLKLQNAYGSSEFYDESLKFSFQIVLASTVYFSPVGGGLIAASLAFSAAGLAVDGLRGQGPLADLGKLIADNIPSALLRFIDPLTLDLDGDGIELTALGTAGQAGASTVFFDFDGDGFKERTGWVKADDGMLAIDLNGNGLIDNGGELFGQPVRDGYEVLETYDTFQDGVIDAKDAAFARLRIWRELDQDGVTDAGELKTLTESGITSISLTRTDVTGTNQGHDRGFQGGFTRANGTTGTAETIYFATDRRDTRVDPTPGFTLAAGVDKLPQLPGSGQINSIAWKATQHLLSNVKSNIFAN